MFQIYGYIMAPFLFVYGLLYILTLLKAGLKIMGEEKDGRQHRQESEQDFRERLFEPFNGY